MQKSVKWSALAVLASGGLVLTGCPAQLHQLLIHVSEITQWAAALDQLFGVI